VTQHSQHTPHLPTPLSHHQNFGVGFSINGGASGSGVAWVTAATLAARAVLGPTLIISHAPQSPYFGPVGGSSNVFFAGSSGGYSSVVAQVGAAVDWYAIQLYNQGGVCYTTYTGLFFTSASDCPGLPGTSHGEIASYLPPGTLLPILKPLLPGDASNGYVPPATLASFISTASATASFTVGIGAWQWDVSAPAWLSTIYPRTGASPSSIASASPFSTPTSSPLGVSDLPVSTNGACGAVAGTRCSSGNCCSQFGFCGSSANYCGTGCQPSYGSPCA